MPKPLAFLALFALTLTCGVLPAQGTASGDQTVMQDRLQQILENQERLQQENRELRSKVDALSASHLRLAAENVELRRLGEDLGSTELETAINSLSNRFAQTAVHSPASKLTLSGELRFRTVWVTVEPENGYPEGGSFDDEYEGWWTDSRMRLGFLYEFSRDTTAFVELQSHWAFGDGSSTDGGYVGLGALEFGEVNTDVDLYQAWIMVGNLFGREEFSMKLGRQEVVLGNQFQFGNADWYSGWVFDGGRFDWETKDWSLTGLILKLNTADGDVNQLHSAFGPHDDDELYSLYFTYDIGDDHTLDIYWIYVNGHGGSSASGNSVGSLGNSVGGAGLVGASTAYYHTIGARIAGMFGVAAGLDYNLEAAFQFGDAKGTSFDDVSGWTLEAEVGLTFNKDSAFRAFIRFLYAEGPEDGDTGYIPLYPNRHSNGGFLARYGLLDALPMFDVLSLQGGFHFKPADDWLLGATFIWSTADEKLVSGDDEWGVELDVWSAYVYSENLTFIFAGFLVFPDDQLEGVAGIEDDTIIGVVFQARLTF